MGKSWRQLFERSVSIRHEFEFDPIPCWIDRSIGKERNVLTRRLPPIRNEFHACTSSAAFPNFASATSRNAGNDGRELQAELVERTVITRARRAVSIRNPRGRGTSISRHASPIPINGIRATDVMSAIINWLSSRRWRESWKRGRGNNGSTGTFIREVWFGA